MNKIISKVLVVIAIIAAGYSAIWFFKTSATKKYLAAAIATSDGKIGAGNVTVTGYPFSQKIVINDFKFTTDDLSEKASLPNKYQVNIKKLEASSGVFSTNFVVNNIDQISFQDVNGNSGYVKFNENPQITFTLTSGQISKLSYKDNGYKIVDTLGNTLYEGGSSAVSFESNTQEDKLHQEIKVEFKDVDGVDIFTDNKAKPIDSSKTDAIAAVATGNPNVAASNSTSPDSSTPSSQNPSVKKYLAINLSYVLAPKAAAKDSGIPDVSINKTYSLESFNVKNLEFSSPNYKVTLSGEFAAGEGENIIETGNATLKIENLNNIIDYIKKAMNLNPVQSNNNIAQNNNPAGNVVAGNSDTIANTPTTNPAPSSVNPSQSSNPSQTASSANTGNSPTPGNPGDNQPPLTTIGDKKIDFASIITDLAKKNSQTTDNVAVFEIKKEKGGDFQVNQTKFSDLLLQLVAVSSDNNNSSASTAIPNGDQNNIANTPGQNNGTIAAPTQNATTLNQTAPASTPATASIPANIGNDPSSQNNAPTIASPNQPQTTPATQPSSQPSVASTPSAQDSTQINTQNPSSSNSPNPANNSSPSAPTQPQSNNNVATIPSPYIPGSDKK